MGPCSCEAFALNMRVHLQGNEAAGDHEFVDQLLTIGDGKYSIDTNPNIIQLSENIGTFVHDVDELVARVYVTVFWKTNHIDTKTEIHLLPVRDRHTHALSRNTKY